MELEILSYSIIFASFYKFTLNNMNISTALSYRPLVDYNSNYVEEVRNDDSSNLGAYPPIIAKNYIDGSGLLSQISFTNGLNYTLNKKYLQSFSYREYPNRNGCNRKLFL